MFCEPSYLPGSQTVLQAGTIMFGSVLSALSVGFLKTLEIFGLTLVGAIPLGLLICLGSMSRLQPLKYVIRCIVWVIRGTPLMLQLLVIYYGPGLILGDNWWGSGEHGRFVATIAAFIINYACYFSEIFRGGIQSIPTGQWEAAESLNLTKTQTFIRVIFPQAVRDAFPSIANQLLLLIFGTSVMSILDVRELTQTASILNSKSFRSMEIFTTVMLFYYAVTALILLAARISYKKWFASKTDRR